MCVKTTSCRHRLNTHIRMVAVVNAVNDGRGMLACKKPDHLLCPDSEKCDAKMAHEEALQIVGPLHSSKLLHFVCVCAARDFVLPVCVLLVAFSAMSRALLVLSPGGTEGSVGADVSAEIRFATTMHLYEKKFASLSSSLWLHTVLCALCFLPKV